MIVHPGSQISDSSSISMRADSASKASTDAPPPYPMRAKGREPDDDNVRRRQIGSVNSNEDPSSQLSLIAALEYREEDFEDESTPLLLPNGARTGTIFLRDSDRSRSQVQVNAVRVGAGSILKKNIFSIGSWLEGEYDDDEDSALWPEGNYDEDRRAFKGLFSPVAWQRYWRPTWKKAYYKSLVHIMCIDLLFGILAWAFTFIFTLIGAILMAVPPIGILFCFVALVGGRALARAEISMQTKFHGPLAHSVYPFYPILTRFRVPSDLEAESGAPPRRETSFYRNALSMFRDSTSYQALFYFLVVKLGVSLVLFILAWVIVPVSFALIIPFPAVLRAMRRLGIWQANIAMDALYLPV